MPEEKVTVSARITKEMYTFCLQEYTNMSVAINAGLDLLKDNKCLQNSLQNVNNHKRDIEQLQDKIKDLQKINTEMKELHEKRVNDLTIRLENTELTNNLIITEKNNLIETLKNELADNKQMHNNYFLQMQTLINQKALAEENTKRKWWQIFR